MLLTFARFLLLLLLLLLAIMETVSVKGPPRLRSKYQREQAAVVAETLRLVCPVDADPPAFVEWQKNGSSIHFGWERFKVRQDGSLLVRDLEPGDAGDYLCRATNGFGSMDFKYHVFFYANANNTVPPPGENDEPPVFVGFEAMREGPILQPVGSTVRLRCRTDGKPRPLVTWYKDGRKLHDAPPEKDGGDGETTSGARYVLKVANLVVEDSGRYTCSAENRVGAINFTYTLEVIARFSDTPEFIPPYLENLTALVGTTVTFLCHMKSNIQPHIQWLKRVDFPHDERYRNTTISAHGQKFIALQRGDVMAQKDGTYLSKLTRNAVTLHDTGLYICAATNMQGFAFRSGYLSVLPSFSNDLLDSEVTSQTIPPLIPIVVTTIIVIFVMVICISLTLHLMRLRREKAGNSPGSKFKAAPFRPQRTVPGFGPLPEKVRGHNQYTFLGPQRSPVEDKSPLQSDPDEGQKVVRVLLECRRAKDKALPGAPQECHSPVSLQHHRHHHTHLHFKYREH